MKILLLCVCHNTHEDFYSFYESLKNSIQSSNCKYEIYLLDNSTSIDIIQESKICELKKIDSCFKYIRYENLGYFGTIQDFLEKNPFSASLYDYICISNVDLTFSDSFFTELSSFLIHPSIALIAPSIITNLGLNKNPKIISRPSKMKLLINKFLYTNFILYKLQIKIHHFKLKYRNIFLILLNLFSSRLNKISNNSNNTIYAAHGSFLIFNSIHFDLVAREKYPIFLYGEEIFVGEILLKNKLKTFFLSNLILYDKEHSSTSKISSSRNLELNRLAIRYLIKKYF